MGGIIKIVTIGGDSAQLEVISNIGGSEEISPDSLELFFPLLEYGRHGWSIRVYPIWRMDWRRHFHYFVRWK